MTQPLVLVACPTAHVKDYALEPYLSSYESYAWKNKNLFMVDTSLPLPHTHGEPIGYVDVLLRHGVLAIHVEPRGPRIRAVASVSLAWPHIVRHADEIGADFIFSNEIDIICPPETISILVDAAERYGAVHVAHAYPTRKRGTGHTWGVGMNLFRSGLFTERELIKGKGVAFKEFEYYAYEKCESNNLPMIKMQDIIGPILHLDNPDQSIPGRRTR
jgi:hypothetical protein